jgi:hypothetical protein
VDSSSSGSLDQLAPEQPSRTLFVKNVGSTVPDDDILAVFQVGGWGALARCSQCSQCSQGGWRQAGRLGRGGAAGPPEAGLSRVGATAGPAAQLLHAPGACKPPTCCRRRSQVHGEVRTLYTACKHRGFVTVTYFDLRAAMGAAAAVHGTQLGAHTLEVHFSAPKQSSQDSAINQVRH